MLFECACGEIQIWYASQRQPTIVCVRCGQCPARVMRAPIAAPSADEHAALQAMGIECIEAGS